MIKGLYFKLNMDKNTDKDIYNFFIQESEKRGLSKIHILWAAVNAYKILRKQKLKEVSEILERCDNND